MPAVVAAADAICGSDAVYLGATAGRLVHDLFPESLPEAILMHDHLAFGGTEAAWELLRDPRTLIRQQSENRLHSAAAALVALHQNQLHSTLVATPPAELTGRPGAMAEDAGART